MKLNTTALIVLPLASLTSSFSRAQDAGSAKVPSGNQDAAGHSQVSGKISTPRIILSVNPRYTDEARRKRIQGICVLSLIVDANGMPQHIYVARSIAELQPVKLREAAAGLDANAVQAVSQYRFSPAMRDGKPVPVQINLEVNFQLF